MTETDRQTALLDAAEAKQRSAADPSVSAWVRANAGTGKTHVLVQRILRLFLSGASPGSVLCLTFTKNAAAEMESRVLGELGKWATAGEEALTALLAKLLSRAPREEEMALAPSLFAGVIDAPAGLAIMTIHGFCERILRRFSFEANVPPGFAVMTEQEARDALNEAAAQVFAHAADGPLRDALTEAVAYASETDFSKVLKAMLGHRSAIGRLLRVSNSADPVEDIEARARRIFGVAASDTAESLTVRAVSALDAATLADAIAALSQGGKSDLDAMEHFQAAAAAKDADQKFAALRAAFLTREDQPRKSIMTKSVRERHPALHERLTSAQAAFFALAERICGLKVVTATVALLRLTAAIFERYEAEKHGRAAVDFDDLIERTIGLLSREDDADWVLYQLDSRIDHILIDEAQDTSPEQWRIVELLTSEFFAGQGARASIPTVFAVGDEKQSIYGFQGARPEELQRYGAIYEKKARDAGFPWRAVDLGLSFRTLAPVLDAVDSVTGALPGLSDGERVPHVAYRGASGGLVELWEPERGEKEEKGAVWETEAARAPEKSPAEALAARIAAKIKHWLASGETLASGRPIQPGDILILLRKRAPMARLLQAALKREGVPVSGADRMALLEELAVMDLLSLASAALQPDDDLALAEVLKSPLFGFCDDDLFELSQGRETSLWQALAEKEIGGVKSGRYCAAAERLRLWRELALRLTPFDFFAHVLEAEGGRKAFASRLGAECLDALDEFLNLAEAFSARALPGLSEFVVSVRQGASEVKRETDQASGEVRVMTVHGAKGLEGAVVILADACGNRDPSRSPIFLVGGEDGAPAVPVWAIKGASELPPIAAAKSVLSDAEQREKGRLLYVAMTRARDRLHIVGAHTGALPAGCWYETIRTALAPSLRQDVDFAGRPVWRSGVELGVQRGRALGETVPFMAPPPWLDAGLPKERPLPILSPSAISASLEEGLGQQKPRDMGRKAARAWGNLIHRLLEVLPALPPAERARAATVIATAFSRALPLRLREDAVEDALRVLSSGAFDRGGGRALAEAGVAVAVRDAGGACRGVLLGQTDKVLFGAPAIHVLDYKSGRAGQSSAFAAQLASYRLALQRIYPAAQIHAALIDTGSATALQADEAALAEALARIMDALAGSD